MFLVLKLGFPFIITIIMSVVWISKLRLGETQEFAKSYTVCEPRWDLSQVAWFCPYLLLLESLCIPNPTPLFPSEMTTTLIFFF